MVVVKLLDTTYEEVIQQLNEGKWEGWYISFPKYQKDSAAGNTDFHYFFKKSAFTEYDSLERIAIMSGIISNTALREYALKGLLPEKSDLNGTRLFHIETVIEAIPRIKDSQLKIKIDKINNMQNPSFEHLSEHQKRVIEKYLLFRENGGVIEFNGYKTRGYINNPGKMLKVIKSKLSTFVLELILDRCDLSLSVEEYKKLDSIPKSFVPDKFNLHSVNQEDFFVFSKNKSFKTLRHYFHTLRPFFYYLLQIKKSEAVLSDEKHRQFLYLEINITNFLNQFPDTEIAVPKNKRSVHREKSFLTREQMIKIKNLLLSDPLSRDNLRNASVWQFCCTSGIRPEELHNIRIEHFLLDENGLLKLNERGWGILDLPAEASKKGISPSHNVYKTPIPPNTVKQLNYYLEYLYKKQGRHNPRGKGYLFRPHYLYPEYQYKSELKKDFIDRIRNELYFLSPAQRETFILKASRHSLNNLIDGYEVILPYKELNGKVQKIAADYQMRHRPNVSALFSETSSIPRRDMGEDHYNAIISVDSFYKVLECTINFPWDLKELEIWEIKYGYREYNLEQKSEIAASKEETKDIVLDNKILTNLQNKFYKLKKARPKDLTVSQWMQEIRRLEKEINIMKAL